MKDILDQAHLSVAEVKRLNFIKDSRMYEFRKYYRSGLRSHIFEVVPVRELIRETKGEVRNGIRRFPKARPLKMFRIFRSRFKTKDDIFREIKKYKLLLRYLGPRFIAQSEEFIADYRGEGVSRIVLCGLQEFVAGRILDPWRLGPAPLETFYGHTGTNNDGPARKAVLNISEFISRVRQMIRSTGYIPDLAGIGNLILTPKGGLKLVDINNIVEIRLDDIIRLDNRGLSFITI